MAGTNALDHYGLADELLQACVAALDTLPTLGLLGAPTRSYVANAEPAADNCCEGEGQLTVHSERILELTTEPQGLAVGKRASKHIRLNDLGLLVTIFRCVPGPEETVSSFVPPAVEELETSSRQLYADAWALWNHLFNRIGAGLLFERCQNVVMQGMRPIPESGGCGGWVLAIQVAAEGYEEVLP